ncbi:MAG: peptidylprolyl isomerase [bacterium]
MALMNNMREYTKTVLIILVLAFVGTIIFDWGMDISGLKTKQGVIGKVNGVEISARQYDEAFARELENYRNRTGSDPPEELLDNLREQVWESLVRDILIQEAIAKNDIGASDQEILFKIYNDPPDFLKNQESFQNEQKQFDMALYQSALNNPSYATQWKPIEDYLRLTLPYEKFQHRLRASVRVTENEVKYDYIKQNLKAKVKYVLVDMKRFESQEIEITDDMIKDYYNNHKDDYQENEKRKIQYVTFSTKATAKDSSDLWNRANDLIQRLRMGSDFADLAEIYSEDPGSKDKGGDLGFFGKGMMVKPFEEAAFAANIGEIVGPVQSNFGLHVIKVEDKRIEKGQEEVKARHILLKFEASQETLNRAREDANYFAEEIKKRPFEEVAAELEKDVQTSEFFEQGNGYIPGLGSNKRASYFIFTKGVGTTGNVDEYYDGYFVFRIADIQKERIQPLDEVRDSIKDILVAENQKSLALELAQNIYEKTQNGQSLEEAAVQDSLEVKETPPFNKSGFVQSIGREPKFIGAAFALKEVGEISQPVEATIGYYILQLVEKDPFDPKQFEAKKELLTQQLLQRKQNQAFADWYKNAKAKADIQDDRFKYY